MKNVCSLFCWLCFLICQVDIFACSSYYYYPIVNDGPLNFVQAEGEQKGYSKVPYEIFESSVESILSKLFYRQINIETKRVEKYDESNELLVKFHKDPKEFARQMDEVDLLNVHAGAMWVREKPMMTDGMSCCSCIAFSYGDLKLLAHITGFMKGELDRLKGVIVSKFGAHIDAMKKDDDFEIIVLGGEGVSSLHQGSSSMRLIVAVLNDLGLLDKAKYAGSNHALLIDDEGVFKVDLTRKLF